MRKSFLNQFNEYEWSLSLAEKEICKYILDNPDEIIKISVQDLAKKCGFVPSTIIKMSKHLGFSGFAELKIVLASELNSARARSFDLENFHKQFGNYDSLVNDLLKQAMSHLSKDNIKIACKKIRNARNIDIYSFGFDSVCGLDLYLKLLQLGKRVSHYENGYSQIISASNLNDEDLIIAISSTGASRDLIDAVNFGKESGATVISLSPVSSILSSESDIPIDTYFSVLLLSEGGIATRIVQLFVVDQLLLELIRISGDYYKEKYKKFDQILSYKRKRK